MIQESRKESRLELSVRNTQIRHAIISTWSERVLRNIEPKNTRFKMQKIVKPSCTIIVKDGNTIIQFNVLIQTIKAHGGMEQYITDLGMTLIGVNY
jgi:hypothetical protein